MRRGVTALAIAIVALGALAPTAGAQDGVNVTIDGDTTLYDAGTIAGWSDIGDVPYTVSPDFRQPFTGTSVGKFLESIGQPVEHVRQIDIERTSITGSILSIGHDRIVGGYDGPNGEHREALFVTAYGQGMQFLRPLGSATDNNGQDWITASVVNHKILPLEVTVERYPGFRDLELLPTVSNPNPKKGDSVQFGVSVRNDPGTVAWRYRWNFDDDGTWSTDRSPAHTYNDPGTWQPSVTVTDPTDGSSKTFVFTNPSINVIGPTTTATPTPTAHATASATPDANRSGGDGGPGAGGGAPTSGGGDGNQKDAATGAKRSKSKSSRATNGATRGVATPTATATAGATATATAAASATAPPHGSGTGNAGGQAKTGEANAGKDKTDESSAPTRGATAAPETAAPGNAAPAVQGEQVDGILLASAGSIADVIDAARSALPTKQDRSQARRGGGDSAPIAGWVGGGAGLFGLLLLGAVREGGFRR
ncbi:PKD domain-containing protein [Solirubrobacter ginsenosidimutans]|uniref:PKD domain-containing protein n=1 Tax=Solirubrobacter ginsenosidimutans TaxID=490573 RepID=A0A9X3S0P2_9ACTN|nr:PKD domain-containing protein [Solirubrobacter ginsenosidimutans]MDA0162255.1 PKD domain-containing protein [Solirubrobacter ginsenosidimutans]